MTRGTISITKRWPMAAPCHSIVKQRTLILRFSLRLADHVKRAHIYSMSNAKLTCSCGAVYEVIETKGPNAKLTKCTCKRHYD